MCKKYFFRSWMYGLPGIWVQSIEYFARARSTFLKLDIWTPRYLGAKYSILCTCKKYIFEVGYIEPQVFRCKVLNTLHVQEVFFRSWIYGSPGMQVQRIEYFARSRSNFSKLVKWTQQVFRCKVLNTLHVQEVLF